MTRRGVRRALLDITPLRTSREFRLLWGGHTISQVGSRLTMVAVPKQVWDLTGSTLAVGLVGAFALLPLLGFSLVGGAIADVFDRRRVMLAAEAIGAVLVALLALNASLESPSLVLVYVLGVASTALIMGAAPSQRSALPRLVERDQLPAANALKSAAGTFAFVLGPAVAGVLLTTVGTTWTYTIDAVTYVVALVVLWRLKPIASDGTDTSVSVRTITDGLRYVRRQPIVMGAFGADFVAMVFGMPTAVFPAIAESRFPDHPGLLGLLYSAPFAGAFLATAFSGLLSGVQRHGRVVVLGIVAWGLSIAAFGLASGLVLSLVTLVAAGAADMVSAISRQTMLQLAATPEMLGRVEGAGMAVWTSGPALGDLEAGVMASAIGLDASVVFGGVACIGGIAVLAKLLPDFVGYDARDGTRLEAVP